MEEIASLTLARYSALARYSPIDAAPAFSDPSFPASGCRTLTIQRLTIKTLAMKTTSEEPP